MKLTTRQIKDKLFHDIPKSTVRKYFTGYGYGKNLSKHGSYKKGLSEPPEETWYEVEDVERWLEDAKEWMNAGRWLKLKERLAGLKENPP